MIWVDYTDITEKQMEEEANLTDLTSQRKVGQICHQIICETKSPFMEGSLLLLIKPDSPQ